MRLAVQANGELKPTDFFAPFDAQNARPERDADFASGGVTGLNERILRNAVGTAPRRRGRQGRLRLPAQPRRTRRLHAGHRRRRQGRPADRPQRRRLVASGRLARQRRLGLHPDGLGRQLARAAPPASCASTSTASTGQGQPTLSLQATSSDSFGFGSGAPVITSEGTTSGSALVWSEWMPNGTGTGAQLRAYDPVPVSGKPVLRWSARDRHRLEVRDPGRRREQTVRRQPRRQSVRLRLARDAAAERSLDELPDDHDRAERAKRRSR